MQLNEALFAHLAKRVADYRDNLRRMNSNGVANTPQWITVEARLMAVLEIQEALASMVAADDSGIANVPSWLKQALSVDGAHHKQFYLRKIAAAMGVEVSADVEPGIAP